MKQFLHILVFLIAAQLLLSCDTKKKFTPIETTNSIVGTDLKEWLETAPFNGLWDPTATSDGDYVLTNVDQVFPFIEKYKDATGSFTLHAVNSEIIHEKHTTVFKDHTYGECVVHASLLYDYQPLFMPSGMSVESNIAFDGINNLNQRYYADLKETKAVDIQPNEKSILYWISANNTRYISGFYQKDQLVFQFAFPFKDSISSIEKIKDLNTTMRLHVPLWQSVTTDQLVINNEPISFWKDPFVGLYNERFIPNLQLKLRDTEYKEIPSSDDGYDYAFAKAELFSTLSFKTSSSALNKLDFIVRMEDLKHDVVYNEYEDPVFITIDQITETSRTIVAQTSFKDDQILEIKATLPANDDNAHKEFMNILRFIRIRKY